MAADPRHAVRRSEPALALPAEPAGTHALPAEPAGTHALPAEPAGTHALPTEPAQAQRFGKARAAQSTARLEDYVEMIADLLAAGGEARTADIARRFGVSHATVVKAVARLKREGLAVSRPYRGIFLTPAGEALAGRVRTRHRLVLNLLRAVGVPEDAAEQDAEGIEHHVSDATLAAFARFLGGR